MKTNNRNPHPTDTLTPALRRLLTILRLVIATAKLLAPLLLGFGLLILLANEVAARLVDTVVAIADHDATAAATTDDSTIETHLECAVDEQGRPAPPCKQCEATTKKLTTSTGATSGARVDFTFRRDDGLPYVGAIEIEVRQRDGTVLVVHEAFVTIPDGQTISVELDDDRTRNIDQVDLVIYRLLTPQPQ